MTRRLILATAAAIAPVAASAHAVGAELGDFYAGALHPLTGVEDVALWLSLGLLAGAQPPSAGRAFAGVAIAAGLLIGAALGAALVLGEIGTAWAAAGMVVVGALLASARRLSRAGLAGFAFALGVSRGIANAAGMASAADASVYGVGLALAGYVVVTLAAAAVASFALPDDRISWRAITLRAYGGWIAAIGFMVGGYALR